MNEPWPSLAEYLEHRSAMLGDEAWAHQYEWAQTVKRPINANDMAAELIFVICNSGMHHQAARAIYERAMAAIGSDQPVYPKALGHAGKARAIETIWADRRHLHLGMSGLDDEQLVEWCGRLPWIGSITKWHAAKNLGANVVKPDRWLERIAARAGATSTEVCTRLASESGDRIATVDLVLWWACATGRMTPTPSRAERGEGS